MNVLVLYQSNLTPHKTIMSKKLQELLFQKDQLDESPLRHDSDEFQTKLTELIQRFLDLKTLIEHNAIFSINESLEDINTSDLKYLTLEYHIAQLYTELVAPSKINNLKKAILLYLTYLTRLNNYDLLEKPQVNKLDTLKKSPFEITTLHATAQLRRDEKIANYKKEKSLSLKLNTLSKLESDEQEYQNTDEELIRELYLEQTQLFTIRTFENIRTLTQELEILQTIPEPKIEEVHDDTITTPRDPTGFTDKLESLDRQKEFLSKEGKVLKPFTIMKRDELKKKVYGTGQYLPTMTVEDFLEQELANGGMVSQNEPQDESEDEDDYEKADRETYKKREWDEFAESHAKGSGNTINRG